MTQLLLIQVSVCSFLDSFLIKRKPGRTQLKTSNPERSRERPRLPLNKEAVGCSGAGHSPGTEHLGLPRLSFFEYVFFAPELGSWRRGSTDELDNEAEYKTKRSTYFFHYQ